jgi:exodeoxyribonuclease I
MSQRSLLWYDLETYGAHPPSDRIAQLALWRTDEALQPIAEPVRVNVRAPWYYLPDAEACLVTGLSPQRCSDGIDERELAVLLDAELGQPLTTSAGYNCIRFDDEFVRHLFWRQLIDPYAREWQHGNQRFDLLDVARLCFALRPEGIVWPQREDGMPSFRLEHLAQANALPLRNAHDALSDVESTIGLARLIRDRQPKLYAWARSMADKSVVRGLLETGKPVVHVSGRYRAEVGCLRLVLPIGPHPEQRNKIAVVDLMQDPRQWLARSVEDLAQALHRRRAETTEAAEANTERPGLKFVHVGRCPMLAPPAVLTTTDVDRIGLDPERCRDHARWMAEHPQLQQRMHAALMLRPDTPDEAPVDPELALYQGFVSASDRARLSGLRARPEAGLPVLEDPRLTELARRWLHAEADPSDPNWRALLLQRFEHGHGRRPGWQGWQQEVNERLRSEADAGKRQLLRELLDWGERANARLNPK